MRVLPKQVLHERAGIVRSPQVLSQDPHHRRFGTIRNPDTWSGLRIRRVSASDALAVNAARAMKVKQERRFVSCFPFFVSSSTFTYLSALRRMLKRCRSMPISVPRSEAAIFPPGTAAGRSRQTFPSAGGGQGSDEKDIKDQKDEGVALSRLFSCCCLHLLIPLVL
jgi:hypothetical protein